MPLIELGDAGEALGQIMSCEDVHDLLLFLLSRLLHATSVCWRSGFGVNLLPRRSLADSIAALPERE